MVDIGVVIVAGVVIMLDVEETEDVVEVVEEGGAGGGEGLERSSIVR